jgi:glycosyltransferase involved in cell wall biosynthesis
MRSRLLLRVRSFIVQFALSLTHSTASTPATKRFGGSGDCIRLDITHWLVSTHRMSPTGISIVIPAYNEEKFLPDTLKSVHEAQAHFIRNFIPTPPTEIIVVNNASTDKTASVAKQLGARVVDHEVRNISSVRNAGIRTAQYSIVVMIDADSFLQDNALTEVYKLMKKGQTVGGGFNVKLISTKRSLRIAAAFFQVLIRAIAGISGAMFFFDRDSALAIGGFREDRLVAEDSTFSMGLRAYGKANGKKRFAYLSHVKVGTLDRKDSDVLTVFRWVSQALQAFLGHKQTIEELSYWYKPKR